MRETFGDSHPSLANVRSRLLRALGRLSPARDHATSAARSDRRRARSCRARAAISLNGPPFPRQLRVKICHALSLLDRRRYRPRPNKTIEHAFPMGRNDVRVSSPAMRFMKLRAVCRVGGACYSSTRYEQHEAQQWISRRPQR